MVWDGPGFLHELRDAVGALDRDRAGELCRKLVKDIRAGEAKPTEKQACTALRELRRKRFFAWLEPVAAAYLENVAGNGQSDLVQLQLIQALIDQGYLKEAEGELVELTDRTPLEGFVGGEARGLLGRVNKQAYLNARPGLRRTRGVIGYLRLAIEHYLAVYRRNPDGDWWPGINVVACLARAERDGIPAASLPDPGIQWRALAANILARVTTYTADHDDYTWAMATATEACVALDDASGANAWCERYIKAPYADVFELGSTERQLREVWQLDERDAPGTAVLRIIQGRLGELGGELVISPWTALVRTRTLQHQAQLGAESTRAVQWLDRMSQRAKSVARVFKDTDPTVSGTGFLVREAELGADWGEGLVLVTNEHVLSGGDHGIPVRLARVEFTHALPGQIFEVREVLCWDAERDVSVCAVAGISGAAPSGLPVGRGRDLRQADPKLKTRLYVVGHPRGGALSISLFDNQMIDLAEDDGHVRYRSPTQEGSSGSPVLSEQLEVVAVHHATRTDREANQGVLIDVVRGLACKWPRKPLPR